MILKKNPDFIIEIMFIKKIKIHEISHKRELFLRNHKKF